jgi:hypothetical protein
VPAPASVAGLRVVGLAGLLGLVGLGATGVVSGFFQQTRTTTTPVTGVVTALDVETGTGDVTVDVAPAGTPVRVTATRRWAFAEPTVTTAVDGGTLRLRSTCDPASVLGGCSVDWTVSVPADAAVRVTTGTGDVRVGGTRGGASVSTGTGDVDLSALEAATVGVETGTGDVRLRFIAVPDQVRVTTGTGDVEVRVPGTTTYRVGGDSGPGSRTTQVPQDPASTHVVTVDTGVGDVLVATT